MQQTSPLLNWPNHVERTEPGRRESCSKFDTGLRQTRRDVETEMSRMGVDEWRIDEVSGSGGDPGVVIRWVKDGNPYAVTCDGWDTKSANLREAYLWVHETRMRSSRKATGGGDSFAAAALPGGGDDTAVVASEPAHAILGVSRDASEDEIKSAFRTKIKEAHSDQGGSDEQAQRIIEAKEELLE